MRILVVEDNVPLANVVRFNLEAAGFRVTVSSDGREACEQAKENQFDLVLTDYDLPIMNGIEVCECLREDPRYAETPIILMSGKTQHVDLPRLCENLNLLAHFPKPFSLKDIVDTVETCLTA